VDKIEDCTVLVIADLPPRKGLIRNLLVQPADDQDNERVVSGLPHRGDESRDVFHQAVSHKTVVISGRCGGWPKWLPPRSRHWANDLKQSYPSAEARSSSFLIGIFFRPYRCNVGLDCKTALSLAAHSSREAIPKC
jgi:hypothetical protein